MPPSDSSRLPAALLKGAAVLFTVLGGGIIAWLVDQQIRHPEIHASQAGSDAPLWIPMIVFVAACTVGLVAIFLRAARRVEGGADLFASRHRRRPSRP